MATKYSETSSARIHGGGGSVKVTLSGGLGQGNAGTSLPCCGCYVQAASANTAVVKMNIGVAASGTLGLELGFPSVGSGVTATCQALWVPTDDVANLYFYSSDADAIVDVLFFVGG